MARFRNKTLRVMVTEEEKAEIKNKMESIGMDNIGAFVRLMMKYGEVYHFDVATMQSLTYEVNKIGVNINQIAKKVNQTDNVQKKELEEINEKLRYIENFVNKIYTKSKEINGGN